MTSNLYTDREPMTEPAAWDFAALVMCAGCMTVGISGLVNPHQLLAMPMDAPPPVVATMLKVSISNDPAGPTNQTTVTPVEQQDPDPAPPPPAIASPDAAPPMQAVAELTPATAFAMPADKPGRIVAAAQAVPMRLSSSATTDPSATPAVRRLVFGQGEGQQPAPEYPREAVLAGNQGTVVVRFTVDSSGRVDSATAQTPCVFPLLNQAAVRTVRDSWRFKGGPPRTYEVSIEFRLQ